ncbi:epoxide hydrolase family protein [Frondihabitans australicus]|uniref:Pimeloyl-ACP methyl ester carboxylesterase n=1 Tax=Frondihabitans australicus TaxID=386892 RepID=A0A495IBG0_9MICO|nr:epoxide hydrolase family protein [Frondihabitans australicus]RKR73334.1 pimeloyl-ACP methyl ester carboxylesterase [Frondihabitans australicus]
MVFPFAPVPESALDDLRARLALARLDPLPGAEGSSLGTSHDDLVRLVERWRDGYDWRAAESRILGLPWQRLAVGSQDHRYLHATAPSRDAPAVVLLHGWPDSVLRFERLLPLLGDLNVVVPALAGFPFAAPSAPGGSPTSASMADDVASLMEALGHSRYAVSAGDVGGDVAEALAVAHPDRVAALHLTNVSPLHAVFADRSVLDEESLAYVDATMAWARADGAYIAIQGSRPATVAAALRDSPVGLAAWIGEKLIDWAGEPLGDDAMLDWITAYWMTGAIGTSFAKYRDRTPPAPYVATPTVLSSFPDDLKPAPLSFASRFVNVQEPVEHDRGGHFAAFERPGDYAADLRRAIALGGL